MTILFPAHDKGTSCGIVMGLFRLNRLDVVQEGRNPAFDFLFAVNPVEFRKTWTTTVKVYHAGAGI